MLELRGGDLCAISDGDAMLELHCRGVSASKRELGVPRQLRCWLVFSDCGGGSVIGLHELCRGVLHSGGGGIGVHELSLRKVPASDGGLGLSSLRGGHLQRRGRDDLHELRGGYLPLNGGP